MQRSYVRIMLLCCVLALLASAALNFAVDPHGVYRWIDIPGFNRLKPKSGVSGQMVKPYRVLEVSPRTLLLGNSRVEVGIDPESPQWPPALRPVYNMALPGTGVTAALRSLEHANSHSKVDLVVMGVDFFDFLSSGAPVTPNPPVAREPSEFERRMRVNADGTLNQRRGLQVVRDHATELFSLNTLTDSLYTVAAQRLPDQADLTTLGFNPLREYRRLVNLDGHYVLFRQVETTYLQNYLQTRLVLYPGDAATSGSLDALHQLIALCRTSNIRLVLYVHPYHAHLLEIYRILGMWPLFEEWKRALVRLVEGAGSLPGSGTVELWDFSGYNEFTTEVVPGLSDKGRPMRWYWEAGHYKRELGELVLARILGDQAPPVAFGVKLDAHDIERQLEAIRIDRARYAEAHRDEIAALEKLAQSVRARSASAKTLP